MLKYEETRNFGFFPWSLLALNQLKLEQSQILNVKDIKELEQLGIRETKS